MLRPNRLLRLIAAGVATTGFALSATAGPAMFQASFLMPAFGNDTSTGTTSPFNTGPTWIGMPIGQNCQDPSKYITTISTYYLAPHYCYDATVQAGVPVIGSGSNSTTGTADGLVVGGAFTLPANAFAVGDWLGGHYTWTTTSLGDIVTGTGTSITPSTHMYGGFTTPLDARNGGTGFLAIYYPYLQSHSYATFHNVAGNFFAGGGPGAVTRVGKAKRAGSWIVTPGANQLGGAMGLLGRLGAHGKYVVPGQPGTYEGSTSWNMVKAMGRTWGTVMNRNDPDSLNPYTNTGEFYNSQNQITSVLSALGTGSLWTTGMISLYGNAGYFETILRRTGYDFTSSGTGTAAGAKVRNIQLITPALTHWQGVFVNSHTGHIGILGLRLFAAPEPGAILLLAAGGGVLALLYRVNRRG